MANEQMLSRGKRLDTDEWAQGYYLHVEGQGKDYILSGKIVLYPVDVAHPHIQTEGFEWFEVNPYTLGRCTGQRDKNGKLVFEGDITQEVDGHYVVTWENVRFCLIGANNGEHYYWNLLSGIEVVGNIHDNPELLEVPE